MAAPTPVQRNPQRAPGRASAVSLAWTHIRIGALTEVQYRVNFWLQLLQSAVALGTAIAVIGLVFQFTDDLGGWSVDELVVLLGVHILLGGVIQALIQPNMQQLMTDILEGTLDFVLIKPADAQLLISVRRFSLWKLVDVGVGVGAIVYGAARLPGAVTVAGIGMFLLTLLLGVVIVYCFWLLITTGAFWVVRMEAAVELFNGLYQAGRWPVTLYPTWLRAAFTVLIPLAFAVTVPAEALTGRLAPTALFGAIAFTLVVVAVTRLVWRTGLRNYAGASA
ncbi:ABC-2 family transporter protein [soil metagenome]